MTRGPRVQQTGSRGLVQVQGGISDGHHNVRGIAAHARDAKRQVLDRKSLVAAFAVSTQDRTAGSCVSLTPIISL